MIFWATNSFSRQCFDVLRLLSFWWGVIKHWGWVPWAICCISNLIHAHWISHRLIYNCNWTKTKCVPLWTVRVCDCVIWHHLHYLGSYYWAEILQWGDNYLASLAREDDVINCLCPAVQHSAPSSSSICAVGHGHILYEWVIKTEDRKGAWKLKGNSWFSKIRWPWGPLI